MPDIADRLVVTVEKHLFVASGSPSCLVQLPQQKALPHSVFLTIIDGPVHVLVAT